MAELLIQTSIQLAESILNKTDFKNKIRVLWNLNKNEIIFAVIKEHKRDIRSGEAQQ